MNKTPLEAFNQFKGIKEYYFQKAKEKGGTLRLFGEEDEICAKVENALKTFEKPAVYVARNRGTTKAMIEALKNMPAVKVTCLSDENKADAFDILKKFLIVGYDMTNRDKPSLTFSIRTGIDETYMFYSTTDEDIIKTFRRAFEWNIK